MVHKVSVIIPTYGRSDLLARAVDSVIGQTYKDVEIVIVDDNPPDSANRIETESKLQKFAGDPRVVYYKREKNGGGSAARNSGIEQATGNYITFLDDDDYYHPTKIERQLSYLEAQMLDVCLCDMDVARNDQIMQDKYYRAQCDDLEDFILHGVAYTPMIFMKKSVAVEIGGFFDTPRFQDHIFMYKLLKSNAAIGVLHERLAVHNDHEEERITSGPKGHKGYQNKILFEKEFMPYLSKQGQRQLKMNHFCTQSKIISDTTNYCLGVVHSFKGLFFIRSSRTFIDFARNMRRNLFFRHKHF
ncbi:glycosyltransferase family 2 protein [Serratia marcescens]|uniref:glycosyltransferase family 2 protein n=1 Tax=Serratia marcescens TaxID=615 RepID=UPI0039837D89